MKKYIDKHFEKIVPLVLFILSILVFVYMITRNGIIGGYDPDFHMARIETLATNLKNGHYPNPIGFEYLGGMGYGVGFFYGNFFLYPFAFLMNCGMPIYSVYKLLSLLLAAFAMISIYFVIKKLTNNYLIASFMMPVYVLNNYYISVIFGRAAIGEAFACIFIPLAIYFTLQIIVEHSDQYLQLAFVMSGLLVSHLINFTIMIFIIALIVIFNIFQLRKNIMPLITLFKAGGMSVAISSIYLLPLIEQYAAQSFKNTEYDDFGRLLLPTSSISLFRAINPFSVSILHQGYVGPLIIWLFIFSAIYCLLHFSKIDRQFTTILIIALIVSLPIYSTRILKIFSTGFPSVNVIQAIWRLNVPLLSLYLIIIAMFLSKININYRNIIISVSLVFLTINLYFTTKITLDFVNNRTSLNGITLNKLIHDHSISRGEYVPKELDKKYNYYKLSAQKVIKKQAGVKLIKNTHNILELQISPYVRRVKIPKTYYKGYTYQIKTNKLSKSKPMTRSSDGMGSIILNKRHSYEKIIVKYRPTIIAYVGMIISISTLIILLILYLYKYLRFV